MLFVAGNNVHVYWSFYLVCYNVKINGRDWISAWHLANLITFYQVKIYIALNDRMIIDRKFSRTLVKVVVTYLKLSQDFLKRTDGKYKTDRRRPGWKTYAVPAEYVGAGRLHHYQAEILDEIRSYLELSSPSCSVWGDGKECSFEQNRVSKPFMMKKQTFT
jgi:hypothetical protein